MATDGRMPLRDSTRHPVRIATVAAAATLAAVDVLSWPGPTLFGLLLLGGIVAGWGHVYSRILCAAGPFVISRLMRAAAVGALVTPAIAAVGRLIGPAALPVLVGAVLLWAFLVTPHGKVAAPSQVRRWPPLVPPGSRAR